MTTVGTPSTMFLHGLESSSQGNKARLLRSKIPGLVVPDFHGSFDDRMVQLAPHLEASDTWILVGSSFGGLMAAAFTCAHPERVRKLVLLAPALHHPAFADAIWQPVQVPTVLIHGTQDDIVPPAPVLAIAQRVFHQLEVRIVDDDHRLQKTAESLDWAELTSIG